nr:hypothetical protein [Endozoicomonas sp.]
MLTLFNHGFDQLDGHTLYQLLKLRVDVFVVEQQCAYPELDDKDNLPSTRHVFLMDGADRSSGRIVACARCLAPGVSFTDDWPGGSG